MAHIVKISVSTHNKLCVEILFTESCVNFKLKEYCGCLLDSELSMNRLVLCSLGRSLQAHGMVNAWNAGFFVSIRVGTTVGMSVGAMVGTGVRASDNFTVGPGVGHNVGTRVGNLVDLNWT